MVGALLYMGDPRLPKRVIHAGRAGGRVTKWAGGEGEIMDGLHGRGS